MNPSASARNFTPSSTAFPSPVSAIAGTAMAGSQMLQGHVTGAAVVNELVNVLASALPVRSVTRGPLGPPLTMMV